jgi:hypothetical protein
MKVFMIEGNIAYEPPDLFGIVQDLDKAIQWVREQNIVGWHSITICEVELDRCEAIYESNRKLVYRVRFFNGEKAEERY